MPLKNTFQTMNNNMFKVNPSKFVFLINEIHQSMVHCKRTEFQYANLNSKAILNDIFLVQITTT